MARAALAAVPPRTANNNMLAPCLELLEFGTLVLGSKQTTVACPSPGEAAKQS